MYSIKAKIPESSLLGGTAGVNSVQCSGVTFTFMGSECSNDGTDVFIGKFPALSFSLYKQ